MFSQEPSKCIDMILCMQKTLISPKSRMETVLANRFDFKRNNSTVFRFDLFGFVVRPQIIINHYYKYRIYRTSTSPGYNNGFLLILPS